MAIECVTVERQFVVLSTVPKSQHHGAKENSMWFYVLGYIITGVIWGYATKTINESKGYEGGFWLGFWLWLIGIIIVACKPACKPNNSGSYSERTGMSSEVARHKRLLNEGGWKCYKCGTVNAAYVTTCGCGVHKRENDRTIKEETTKEEARINNQSDQELINLAKLKSYKELLDLGAITQEEFEKKKSELLK